MSTSPVAALRTAPRADVRARRTALYRRRRWCVRRTKNALADDVKWNYLGGPLGINATGTVEIDPNDPTGQTVYVGTGEANICGSGCVAGTGIYKSTDGGNTWSGAHRRG